MSGSEWISEVARAVDVLQKAGIQYRDLQINPGEGGSHFSLFVLARQPRPPGQDQPADPDPRLARILTALDQHRSEINAKELAHQSGYKYNSHFRKLLLGLCQAGQVNKTPRNTYLPVATT